VELRRCRQSAGARSLGRSSGAGGLSDERGEEDSFTWTASLHEGGYLGSRRGAGCEVRGNSSEW
jgi:hypothetical protein